VLRPPNEGHDCGDEQKLVDSTNEAESDRVDEHATIRGRGRGDGVAGTALANQRSPSTASQKQVSA
jgi:hypothetical protein